LKIYSFIRENGGWQNFDMIQIEQFNATDKRSLHARERHWIEELQPSLNGAIPNRTYQEWCEDNKESIAARMRQYSRDNCEAIAAQKKLYQKNNKEALAAYQKRYSRDTKDTRTCICGQEYNYGKSSDRKQHYRSQSHQTFVLAVLQVLQDGRR
jgi:hypothetical protein